MRLLQDKTAAYDLDAVVAVTQGAVPRRGAAGVPNAVLHFASGYDRATNQPYPLVLAAWAGTTPVAPPADGPKAAKGR